MNMSTTLDYFKKKYAIFPPLYLYHPSPIEIPGVSRLDLIKWIRELDLKMGAEIGVYVGEFSRLILRLNPQLKLYGVDPWIEYKEYKELDGQDFNNMYKETLLKMATFIKKGRYVVVRKTSMDALRDFADNSLDFVYIDANHEDPYVTQDIEGWAAKVRPGGLVTGHDYIRVKALNYAIIDALDTYTKKNNIQLFLLGSKAIEPRVIRDRVRSWMFIRP